MDILGPLTTIDIDWSKLMNKSGPNLAPSRVLSKAPTCTTGGCVSSCRCGCREVTRTALLVSLLCCWERRSSVPRNTSQSHAASQNTCRSLMFTAHPAGPFSQVVKLTRSDSIWLRGAVLPICEENELQRTISLQKMHEDTSVIHHGYATYAETSNQRKATFERRESGGSRKRT